MDYCKFRWQKKENERINRTKSEKSLTFLYEICMRIIMHWIHIRGKCVHFDIHKKKTHFWFETYVFVFLWWWNMKLETIMHSQQKKNMETGTLSRTPFLNYTYHLQACHLIIITTEAGKKYLRRGDIDEATFPENYYNMKSRLGWCLSQHSSCCVPTAYIK